MTSLFLPGLVSTSTWTGFARGSGAKCLREPSIGLRVSLADIDGGQDRNCRGAGRWQQSGD